ncbi:lysophospholipid acyltransferase family protein [Marivita sp. XM-24bin2]|jgi:1-acyl-sn-glycerol-3-phosphate acyltransferase|uniref:lysophospholipid acyltransferase family protein n=1 Tax=unclassified Marivita TaxID=2632480 RepID=UPI000D7A9D3E|nr:lysophospholipid acyltransferase family protein [Marivita sp. XM-24bin2]MCR9107881.1 1-acyl-sn-glycerol-3-phosphate acyltransferase [Paracoccaceae bacterium]PWL34610.1 MAG: 1-acyl-sn-glycerol-3-phosphate acyltransferase [Marivita sp. XM-24bin2]
MSPTWDSDDPVADSPISAAGWLRVLMRGSILGAVVFGGLGLMLLLRLFERPIFGVDRPITPYITRAVCRSAFVILRLPLLVRGPRMKVPGAVVANHGSWLDIFALNARKNVYFVSKSEVAAWPGIGWLARATGTMFIRRDPRDVKNQIAVFEERLQHGHRLLFFPEGTSTDTLRVLPFKPTLFAPFFSDRLVHDMHIQPVTVIYHAPEGADPRFYGWWGDMGFAEHLLKVLAQRAQGRVELVYHAPVRVDAFPNRKSLASHLEAQVRSAHSTSIE